MASKRALMPTLTAARRAIVGTGVTGIREVHGVAAGRALVRPTLPKSVQVTSAGSGSFKRRYSEATSGGSSKIWGFGNVQILTQEPDTGVVIVDVREPDELKATGRIPTAINIPITSAPESFNISDEDFEDRFGYPRPSKDTEVVFYCKAGVRSRAAAGLARGAGWTHVGEYPGSWMDWAANGGKIEK